VAQRHVGATICPRHPEKGRCRYLPAAP
jgi:hypothetical protein